MGSSARNSVIGKCYHKSSPKNFMPGDAAEEGFEASHNEGGVAGVRHGH